MEVGSCPPLVVMTTVSPLWHSTFTGNAVGCLLSIIHDSLISNKPFMIPPFLTPCCLLIPVEFVQSLRTWTTVHSFCLTTFTIEAHRRTLRYRFRTVYVRACLDPSCGYRYVCCTEWPLTCAVFDFILYEVTGWFVSSFSNLYLCSLRRSWPGLNIGAKKKKIYLIVQVVQSTTAFTLSGK